jgi:hypothetical protein
MKKAAVLVILAGSLFLVSCSKENAASNSSNSSAIASPAAAATPTASPANSFTVCKGTFALCTTATCGGSTTDQVGKPIPCACEVKQGFSVGTNACSTVPQEAPTPGQAIPSRYFPIQSMAVCEGRVPFAMCLDSPCVVDKKDPTKANCNCNLTASKNYVVVAATASDSMCRSAVWSSASLEDVIQITGFLYAQNPQLLKPFPINIVRVDSAKN